MKNAVKVLLEPDHESLGHLLTGLQAELAKPDIRRGFELLDLFWARLAVHIRAENLHLFPALANASCALFTERQRLPTFETAQNVLRQLRSDHDFFMKELAQIVRTMRELVANSQTNRKELEQVRRRLSVLAKRLEIHNQVEEEQAYTWPKLLFDDQATVEIGERLRHELENLPPRFLH
jgi:hypothetical protein